MAIQTEDENGKFSYETTITFYNERQSKSMIQIPFSKVREKNLKDKKLRITVEVIEE